MKCIYCGEQIVNVYVSIGIHHMHPDCEILFNKDINDFEEYKEQCETFDEEYRKVSAYL